jgi:hypothetical protein
VQWEWLGVVLPLLVWIAHTFLRGEENERNPNRPRTPSGTERSPVPRSARRPSTDLDRFLDEVNRRRRQVAERRPAPAAREQPPPRPLVPPVRRQPTPTPPRPDRPRVVDQIPVLEVVPVSPSLQRTASAAVSTEEVVALSSPASPLLKETPPSTQPKIATFLKNVENLRMALVLREVLGPPLCRRQWHALSGGRALGRSV